MKVHDCRLLISLRRFVSERTGKDRCAAGRRRGISMVGLSSSGTPALEGFWLEADSGMDAMDVLRELDGDPAGEAGMTGRVESGRSSGMSTGSAHSASEWARMDAR